MHTRSLAFRAGRGSIVNRKAVHTILLIGGARSGKSRRAIEVAERLSVRLSKNRAEQAIFIATAEPSDKEMDRRIERHRSERGSRFETVEAPVELVAALEEASAPDRVVVVDCLTLWLANLMHYEHDVGVHTAALVQFLEAPPGPVILVSNEVGSGLVPTTGLGRTFRDAQGSLNQAVAQACQRVEFMVAGLAVKVKPG